MSQHRSSIPLNPEFTPPPAITLGRTCSEQRDKGASLIETEKATAPASATVPKNALKTTLRKRLTIILAVLAVPAMAAPGDFGAIAGDAPAEPESSATIPYDESVMAFEEPGMSFPGSAFYYLDDPPETALVALPTNDPLDRGAAGGREVGALIDAGPAARAFVAGSGANYLRAQDCLAQAIWYEAASESEAGQRAVAQVVLNRVAHPSWPSSVCGVVYEGSQRSTGCQFTFTCDGSLKRRSPSSLRGATWSAAQRIATEALNGSVYAPIGHATHYHTLWVNPYWAKTLDLVGVIGAHRFYRNRGNTGARGAFTATYSGAEPAVTGRASSIARSEIGEAPVTPDAAATTNPVTIPAPVSNNPTESAEPKAGQARKKYARAGQWKVDPSSLNLAAEKRPEEVKIDPAPEPEAP